MFRVLFTLLLLPALLFAHIENEIIGIESKLFGKILFLDYDYKDKLVDGKVLFYIVYDSKKSKKIAKEFAKNLKGKRVLGVEFDAKLVSINRIKKGIPTAYIAILNMKNMSIAKKRAIAVGRLLFVMDRDAMKHAMVSVYLGSKIVPIINIKLIKSSGIELRPIIFKVAKVYENDKD